MSRTKFLKRKRQAAEAVKSDNRATVPSPDHASGDPKNIQAVVIDEDLEITIDTLQTIAKYPNLIKSKACRDLRTAVYDFRQACTIGVNAAEDSNLTSRITAALADAKYTDALVLLAEMQIRNESPKLGALCRWVRDLDVVSGLSMKVDGVSRALEWSAQDRERLRILASILRVSGPTDTSSEGLSYTTDPIRVLKGWDMRSDDAQRPRPAQCSGNIKELFRVIETTPGQQRKPPNLHPAILHASRDDAILLSNDTPPTSIHHHPVVPHLSLIKDVLFSSECCSIIAAAQTVGFTPDAPIMSSREDVSVLAHNFYWIVDESFAARLWQRVKPHVPEQVDGRLVRGLNRRFRVYRYVPGAEYRCHIDGAWPPSGINPVDDTYIYDASPATAKQSSLYTFLLYLNDEFEAGETTFFMPSIHDGVMNAYPVKPVAGAAAIFPHGEGKGALLHEGSGVRSGAKYIIRTDVLYDINKPV
ncbi:uncharacterized protein HMPREF1541_07872 [Cyphellophora europaea CBS 101466]|uniref:Fe2OG dioxygenase domain-containing protein n=1 Tax=Cyphellophora europaea (strain CBS 101466) TaxID=1220924 RepID=W2RKQ7_CYPE1|nr:uncharacterized protein HMPREF1541_07872 [Cyphellophora europaea CBS 101466]ETN36885.1 hypothetical protein HMPREF1541_07872 [Cyphellophora europaea CBS 101466]